MPIKGLSKSASMKDNDSRLKKHSAQRTGTIDPPNHQKHMKSTHARATLELRFQRLISPQGNDSRMGPRPTQSQTAESQENMQYLSALPLCSPVIPFACHNSADLKVRYLPEAHHRHYRLMRIAVQVSTKERKK